MGRVFDRRIIRKQSLARSITFYPEIIRILCLEYFNISPLPIRKTPGIPFIHFITFVKIQREYPAACCGYESQGWVASSPPFPAIPTSLLGDVYSSGGIKIYLQRKFITGMGTSTTISKTFITNVTLREKVIIVSHLLRM
jgi:hypothetical protein